MLIGVPKEVKEQEYRVGLTPAGVKALISAGHEVHVESNAGTRVGFTDDNYAQMGAKIVSSAQAIYACPMIVKIKEPQPSEVSLLQENQVLFGYLHLAANPLLAQTLLGRKIVGIAYETVTLPDGSMPLLTPMSEVAGRIAVQAGATALQMANGGNGTLLGGVPGVGSGKVLILGAGTVGTNAAKMAIGLGADVTILDRNLARLRHLDDIFASRIKTIYSDPHVLEQLVPEIDLLIGAVLIPGKQPPKLISRKLIQTMKPGSVFVDVAIDQGGCAETSRPTTHAHPTYIEEGVVHYCVTNIPAACAKTSTLALTNATLPYALQLAQKGYKQALMENPGLRDGLNLYKGAVTHSNVAEDLGLSYTAAENALSSIA